MTDLFDVTPLDDEALRFKFELVRDKAFDAYDAARINEAHISSARMSIEHELDQRLAAFEQALPAKIAAILKELGVVLPPPDVARDE